MAYQSKNNLLYSYLEYRPNGTIVKVYINEDWREIRDNIGLYTFGEKIGMTKEGKVLLKYLPEDKHPENLTGVYCIESNQAVFKGKIIVHEREIENYT